MRAKIFGAVPAVAGVFWYEKNKISAIPYKLLSFIYLQLNYSHVATIIWSCIKEIQSIKTKKAARFLLPPSGSRYHRSGKPKSLRCSFQSSGMFFIICAMKNPSEYLFRNFCSMRLENLLFFCVYNLTRISLYSILYAERECFLSKPDIF